LWFVEEGREGLLEQSVAHTHEEEDESEKKRERE
jgi:hypothetical protein